MGSQGPQCHGGCQKFHFREFSVSCSQTSSCARKPLVLRHRCIVYTSMWQVSSGLKEDEMGSQTPHYVRGGCKKIIFDLSRSLAPKKVQVGKDQEKAQSEKDSHSKNRGGKKPKPTIRYLYHETYRKPNEQLFSQ